VFILDRAPLAFAIFRFWNDPTGRSIAEFLMQPILKLKRAPILWGALLCGLYALLTIIVNARVLVGVDHEITTRLQQIIPCAVDLPSSILSLLGSAEVTVLIFAALVLLARPQVRVKLVALFVLVTLLELQGKTMIDQPGPPRELLRYVFAFGTPTGEFGTPFSYPSGHAARTSFLVALAITLIAQSRARSLTKRSLIALLIAVEAVMLVSRIYIGDHWTSDVIGGTLLGVSLSRSKFTLTVVPN
jgi:membrane-associated phospholipid phosphatase